MDQAIFLRPPKEGLLRNNADYTVHDSKVLAEVMNALLGRHGTQAKLVEPTGISQGAISKLRNGKVKSVTSDTLVQLLLVMTDAERKQLEEAFISPDAKERMGRYRKWMKREYRRYNCGVNPEQDAKFGLPPGGDIWTAAWMGEPEGASASGVLAQLDRIPEAQQSLNGFAVWLRRQWANAEDTGYRRHLALLQIASPLTGGTGSGGIDRTVEEMHRDGDLIPYLEASMRAQEHLLRRDTSWARARTLAEGLPPTAPKRTIRPKRRRIRVRPHERND